MTGTTRNVKLIAPVLTLAPAFTVAGNGQTSLARHSGKLLEVQEDVESVSAVPVSRIHLEGKKDRTAGTGRRQEPLP